MPRSKVKQLRDTAPQAKAQRCSIIAGLEKISSHTPWIAALTSKAGFCRAAHIPIYHPDRIRETKPDYVVILPWNLKDEIIDQLHFIREWGGQFVVPIPKVTIC